MSEEADRRLRAAKDLLLRGERKHSNGSLSVTALAQEAVVSRSTANRATKVLKEFRDAVKDLRNRDEATHPVVVAERLQRTLTEERAAAQARIRTLEGWNDTLAQQVQALTLVLEGERANRGRATEVLPITSKGRRKRDADPGAPPPPDQG